MAEVVVDERRLLKTMRWWDGFVIGLANPGFLLVGLGFSVGALGPQTAAILWFVSALVGALQAYVYAEPAAMFPDKPGGLSVYAREGWRKYFSLAGPIAVFGYWFAWSSVLAVYGGLIGTLIVGRFFTDNVTDAEGVVTNTNDFGSWEFDLGPVDVTSARLIATVCILSCYVFNIRGMRPAVWFSYVTGAMMVIPVVVLAVGPFLTGEFNNYAVGFSTVSETVTAYGDSPTTFNEFGLIMVWLYVIGWSTYGPEAPATFAPEFIDTKNDTRKAIASTGALNVFLAALLPLAIVGTIGYQAVLADLTGIVYMIDVFEAVVGNALSYVMVLFLCAGLLLAMNTATMDGSRALYALSKENMTLKQLGVLNSHHVPARAMTLDMLLNIFLLFAFPTIFFILAAGNLGYMLSHVLALTGFLLLRRDRPNWPRPLKHGPAWVVGAAVFAVFNLLCIVFGVIFLTYTGYAWDVNFTDPNYYKSWILVVGVLALVAGVAGYVIAQYQHGKKFRWTDPSDEQPSAEVLELMRLEEAEATR